MYSAGRGVPRADLRAAPAPTSIGAPATRRAVRVNAWSAGALTFGILAVSFALGTVAHSQAVAPAITPARISIDNPIAPGSTVDLPSIVVRNHGTEPLTTTMGVVIDGEDGEDTRDWIRFDPANFDLDVGEARVVDLTLEVPDDVLLGPRVVRLRASARQDTQTTGVAVGITAAVASLLVFDVGWPPEGVIEASSRAAEGSSLQFLIAVPLAILAGAASWSLMTFLGRYEFVVRRKPPPD